MQLVNKIKSIASGWTSLLLDLNTPLAKKRAEFCKVCQFAEFGKFESFINDELTEIQGMKCGLCKCPLSAKLRSKKEICPVKKW